MSFGSKPRRSSQRGGRQRPEQDEFKQALTCAYRLLGYRQRSIAEMTRRLKLKGFDEEVALKVVKKLTEVGYMDDKSMAGSLRLQAEDNKMLGLSGAKQYMWARGIKADDAEEALKGYDERAGARRLAEKKIQKLNGCTTAKARQRMMGYLKRRGFSYDTIKKTIDEFIKETK